MVQFLVLFKLINYIEINKLKISNSNDNLHLPFLASSKQSYFNNDLELPLKWLDFSKSLISMIIYIYNYPLKWLDFS